MSGNHSGGKGLETYRAKRDAGRTPEPFGGRPGPRGTGDAAGTPALFAVHKHGARRLHYDLRLEIDGVLVSWALPRGPSLDPAQKRLAVHVEDHPLEYASFEGVIPDGNYGAGATILWDTGTWVPIADPRAGLREGKLEFDLQGYKLRGRFTLVRTGKRGGDEKQWLLIKKPDGFVTEEALDEASVLSGLTVEELRAGGRRGDEVRARLEALGAPRARVELAQIAPMLCQTAERPFSDPDWVFELKYDGYRLLAGVDGGRVSLRYRSGLDATALFPELTRALAALPLGSLVLDGEVVVLDAGGRPVFQSLQSRNQIGGRPADIQRAAALAPVSYMVFDLLACEGHDLRPLRLIDRKEVLREILPGRGPVRFADHIAERGEPFFASVLSLGLEGVVAKRADSTYQGLRSEDWLKIRQARTGDFVIVGYTSPKGSRAGFGSLHLAAWNGRWVYMGRVGTGFDTGELAEISARLRALPAWEPDFEPPSSPGRSDHWLEPRLVCEVGYQEVSRDGRLRAPRFLHLRADKAPRECAPPAGSHEPAAAGRAVLQVVDGGAGAGAVPRADDAGESAADSAPESATESVDDGLDESTPDGVDDGTPDGVDDSAADGVDDEVDGEVDGEVDDGVDESMPDRVDDDAAPAPVVEVTNPAKPFWPGDDGSPRYTKADLVGYYRAIAPWLLPYLRDRPVALVRYPDGITGHAFFQKDAPAWVPGWLRTSTLWSKHAEREVRYFMCDSAESLAFVANLGAIPLHVWSSRVESLGYPDWCILDLDPKEAPFVHVVEIARALRALCDQIALPSFIKTSGSTGLHVLIPLHGSGCTHDQSRDLALLLARVIEAELPDIATTARRLEQRRGRVYLDFVQNGHGRLLVAPFSVRPLPGAPVSMPLRWSEVTARLDVRRFTIANAVRRLERLGRDPLAGVLDTRPDLPRALALLDQRMRAAR
jgi:bifunctional non-homologous end joining protein LigD